jgi:hypothetical protein
MSIKNILNDIIANKNNSLPINFTPLNKDGLKRFGSKK